MRNSVKTKFAWLPVIVDTWRPSGSRALVWLQTYNVKVGHSIFSSLNGETEIGTKWVNHLGLFSYEF